MLKGIGSMWVRRVGCAVALAVIAAGCGGDDGEREASPEPHVKGLRAVVASYEVEARSPQRVLVGLVTSEEEQVGFGEARLRFEPAAGNGPPIVATGTYRLLPGEPSVDRPSEAVVVSPGEGSGIYAADGVTFPTPGRWRVIASISLNGVTERAGAELEVLDDSTVLEVGDRAPATVNHLPGAAGVPPGAVDSRSDDADVPDKALHQVTIADALARQRPLMVVVSTPVYCVSRFCGPVTDVVDRFAGRFGDRMDFVHLEVWRDYEGRAINKAAAEWIFPASGVEGAREPWVFVIGRDGTVATRLDNVASEVELQQAITDVLA